jgi:hypothetical protein
VDFPASTPIPAPRRRSAARIAWMVAGVELVLLVVAAVAIFGKPFADGVEKAAATSVAEASSATAGPTKKRAAAALPKEEVPAAELTRHQTSVLVLNGNGRAGAATQAAGVVRSLNYLVAGTANAPRLDFRRSLVMFRPGYKGEAYRLAKDVRVKQVSPLDGMTSGDLGGAHVVLVVGG